MPDRRGWFLAAMGVVLGLGAGIAAWGKRSEASGASPAAPVVALTPVAAPVVGGLAPDFEASGIDGDRFSMSESRGRVVLLNFWAISCEPCRAEMPLLETRYQEGAPSGGVLVVGINSDELPDQIRSYAGELELTFPLLLDPGGEIQVLYRVRGYPTTFFVDEGGMVRRVHVGSMNAETLDGYLHAMGAD